uniref:Uncharacterized protein n=1 Tax=Branchiostoma floridae TaxID=7739 RepID=C3YL52_BRAFL|eukprot:XP_002603031.1 hypothetical protein BRAFLDRAFT_84769 [Branchiostoma floridae]
MGRPVAVAASSPSSFGKTREIFVVDFAKERIQVHDTTGVLRRRFVPTVPGRPNYVLRPSDIATDNRNNVWVVGFNYVIKYNPYGAPKHKIELAVGTRAYGVSVSRFSFVYVLVQKIQGGGTENAIMVYTERSGSHYKTLSLGLTTSRGPFYITVGGLIYISDTSSDQIDVYRSDGRHLVKFGVNDLCGVQISKPRGMGTDRQGNVLVTSEDNGRVDLYTSRGEFERHVVTGLQRPKAVAAAPGGLLVVIDSSPQPVKIFKYE